MKKTLLIGLIFLMLMAAIAFANDWCYQEYANESTTCGGLETGSYSDPTNAAFDGDWYSYMSGTPATETVTYQKPMFATNESLWQMAHGFNEENFFPNNYTIPTECWASSRLMFEIKSVEGGGGPENSYGCYDDGMTYYAITSGIYLPLEEAMWWDIGPCVPDWSCIGYASCINYSQSCNEVADDNSCNESYAGNYSEFSIMTCNACYQEFANESTCNGQQAGYYWTYPDSLLNDGDWSTYSNIVDNAEAIIYHRPASATIERSRWQIKDGAGTYNLTIPQVCWDSTQLLMYSSWSGGLGEWGCLDDMWNFYPLYDSYESGAYDRYEEAFWWDAPVGACQPDWECVHYSRACENQSRHCDIVSDNNECGLIYVGNYSEFTTIACDPSWCYQEFANRSTECGGIANQLPYNISGPWDGGVNQSSEFCIDGDWYSLCCSDTSSAIIENYTKPAYAFNATWIMSSENPSVLGDSYELPQACWDASPDSILVRGSSSGIGAAFDCWDGNGWVMVRQYSPSSRCFYEEAMYWGMHPAPVIYDYTGAKMAAWVIAIILFLWIVPQAWKGG